MSCGSVLTSPGHVFQESLSFLIELLDSSNVSARNAPKDLISTLPQLIRTCDSQQSRQALNDLLLKGVHSTDRHALRQLWSVANRTLPIGNLRMQLLRYPLEPEDLAAQVKLLWPAEAHLNFQDIRKEQQIPCEPPSRAWAEHWFRAAFIEAAGTGVDETT